MSITRLQQARQMYATGQRVARTMDGSRPGYKGSDWGPGAGSPGTTSTGGNVNNGGNRPNPHRDPPNVEEAYEMIGGKKFDVTPETRDERERARVKESLINPITKKNTVFDPVSNSFVSNQPPKKFKPPSMMDLLLMGASGGLLGGPLQKAAQLYGTYNKTKKVMKGTNNLINDLSKTYGFENPIANLFSGNQTSTPTSITNNITNNSEGGGDGLASIENQAATYDEYILLLQKLQAGNISEAERNRYTLLKNILGI